MPEEIIKGLLEQLQTPLTYEYFEATQDTQLPRICFYGTVANNFFADGIVYASFSRFAVILQTKFREPTLENQLENIFTRAGFAWVRTEQYAEKQYCYERTYEIEVLA